LRLLPRSIMSGTVCPVSEISGLDIPRPGACAESAPPAVEVARW
jgi:hypothetical protein